MPDGDVIEGIGLQVGLHQDVQAIDAVDVATAGGFDGESVLGLAFVGAAVEGLDLHGVSSGEGARRDAARGH